MAALGIPHGFTTRPMGNMKDPARRREAAGRAGLADPLTLKQVHGTAIHRAAAENAGLDGDGWIVDACGVAVAVYVADCVPLYLWTEDGRAAGVFHAGWRGTAAGMAKAAVAAFVAHGAPAKTLHTATGPHIGACCYRVGVDLEEKFPTTSFLRRDGAAYLDLAAETRRQLFEAGVPEENIGPDAPCTASHADDYFSYRRDKQDARHCAFLSLKS